jgi:lipopolysaccharide/colanic/teichoic acid biosynthesis glycosyltransferase
MKITSPKTKHNDYEKRFLDLFFAFSGLIILLPILLFIWGAVVLGSGRPGIFRQTRVGRMGRDFPLYKFRTMRARKGASDGLFEAGSLVRITPIGRLLRKSKLDELPQLWNVLRGDMSLVGPRPEVRKWVEAYPERWAVVLSVRPGITDPASIEFRDEEAHLAASPDPESMYRNEILPVKLSLYEAYVANRSLGRDLRILLRTLFVVFKG